MPKPANIDSGGLALFADLVLDLELLSDKKDKYSRLQGYIQRADQNDSSWALAFLLQTEKRKLTDVKSLLQWSCEKCNLPNWLIERSLDEVRDKSEVGALILDTPEIEEHMSLHDCVQEIDHFIHLDKEEIKNQVYGFWDRIGGKRRVVFNKLITATLSTYSAAQLGFTPVEILRLYLGWDPRKISLLELFSDLNSEDRRLPKGFVTMVEVKKSQCEEKEPNDYIIQQYWQGIRVQIIKHKGQVFIWTEHYELITSRSSMMTEINRILPAEIHLEGMVVGLNEVGRQLSIEETYRALMRKAPGRIKLVFLALDILGLGSKKVTSLFSKRRNDLSSLIENMNADHILIAEETKLQSVLSNLTNPMLLREKSGSSDEWLLLKPPPFEILTVLLYVENKVEKSSYITELTLGIRSGNETVPIAKVSAPEDEETMEIIQRLVKKETIERFGPVRSVTPKLIFQLTFESIQESGRRRAGIVLISPKINRLLVEKTPESIASLSEVLKMNEER